MLENNLEKLTLALAETFDYKSLGVAKDNMLLTWAKAQINELLELNHEDVKAKRCDYFNIPGVNKDDFSETLFNISADKNVLAGIRHAGGNIEVPFIHITPDFPILDLEELERIKTILTPKFEKFSPLYLDCWVNPRWRIHDELLAKAEPRQRYIVGRIKDLIEQNENITLEKEISLQRVEDRSFYPWYHQLYADFHRNNPGLKDWVPINDEEDMFASMEENLLWYVYAKDKRIGIVQGETESIFNRPSLYMAEILLDEEYRGRALAPKVQIEFIRKNRKKFDIVWGTIDQKNIPSMKTALKVGRRNIRSAFMVPIVKK